MGTKCVARHIKDESDGMPQVPPGFASVATFTLQRVHMDAEASSACSLAGRQVNCNGDANAKFRKSLQRRPWVNYNQFDNSSDEEEPDTELSKMDGHSVQCLPKGVLRGCDECANCQNVVARWKPDEACRPILDETPVFYPSEEEFKDTLKYIERIRPVAGPYGIARIVPPSSWKPPCLLKEKSLWQDSKFSTRVQQIHKLQKRGSAERIYGSCNTVGRKRQKILKTGIYSDDLVETNQLGKYRNAERFGFESGPDFTLESFQKYADDFKELYFQTSTSVNSHLPNEQIEPSVGNIEGEYWRIVERPTEEIEVLYGADLDTAYFGSGFPKSCSASANSNLEDEYVKSGWNLNSLPRLPGSVLCFESGHIPGVLIPWLYAGMCFSSFCWHVEDHHLYSLNYLHLGAPKVWYGVPGKDASKFEACMKKHLPDLFEQQPDLLHNLVTQFSPSLLKLEGVPVYRCVQHEGEFVLTFPRAYHSGFNCGFNCAEAVNVAPVDWLPHGQTAVEFYREQKRRITLSHDKLLLGAAKEAVRAQWYMLFLKNNMEVNLLWKNACGVDGILTRALKARTAIERTRREYLCCLSQSKKMDAAFDVSDRECAICHYDLYLSAASCPCCQDKYACLIHARQLCSCAWNTRAFLFRYDITELNVLLDALGGRLSAIHRWGIVDLGLTLTSYMAKDKAQDSAVVNGAMRGGKQVKGGVSLGKLTDCARSSDLSKQVKAFVPQDSCSEVAKDNGRMALTEGHSSVGKNSSSQLIEESNILSRVGYRSSHSSSSHSSSHLPSEGNVTSTSSRCSGGKDKHFSNSKMTVIKQDKGSSSGIGDVISANHGDKKDKGYKNQEESTNRSDLPNQQTGTVLPQDASSCSRPANVSIAESISKILAVKEVCDSSSTDSGSQLENPQPFGSRKPHGESLDRKTEPPLEHDAGDRANQVLGSQPFAQNVLEGCNSLQKGPGIAKVVRRNKCAVEPLEYGIVMSGKLWSTSKAIFPKGYRSRVSYFCILDPTERCYYTSEILDGGLLGPLFMVTVEHCPSEVFIHVSATKCWDMVRERVNQEIRRQHEMKRQHGTARKDFPPGSVDGLEMFGLSSPEIIQAIEALDGDHVSREYWNSKTASPAATITDDGIREQSSEDLLPLHADSTVALGRLFKKANPEELLALQCMLGSDVPHESRQEAILLLKEEINNRRRGRDQ